MIASECLCPSQEANADWLTEAGHALFAQGTPVSVLQAQEEAYATLAMTDCLTSPFCLDSAQPAIMLSDVRAQPPKQDKGYDTQEAAGDLPDMTAIIHTLMLHRELIMRNHMI